MDIKRQLNNALETGNVLMGTNKAVDSLLYAEPKLIVISKKCPKKQKESIMYYSGLAGVGVEVLNESAVELGSSFGRSHPVNVLTVLDEGDSTILEVKK